jgi:hypothetical protein
MNSDNAGKKPPDQVKEVTVIFNGRPKTIPKESLSFEEVIAHSFETAPSGDGVQFTVQYTRGHGNKPTGTLLEGESVKVKDGMEFDVTPTNRS